MASVLDLRRRIRSVKNTRQITKAMKLVAAAKLRRAQEAAIRTRPYATMLTSVIRSLARRIEIYDPETGAVRHPLLLSREEKTIALIVLSGDKGFAGAFNGNIAKTAFHFLDLNRGRKIDIEVIGRKGRALLHRRVPVAELRPSSDHGIAASSATRERRRRRADVEITGEHLGMLGHPEFDRAAVLAREIIDRYIHEEIDAAFLVFNEFKSVMAQRVVVERILPIVDVGSRQVSHAEEMDAEDRRRAGLAAVTSGLSLEELGAEQEDGEAASFGTAEIDYVYEQPPRELLDGLLRQYVSTVIYRAVLESVAAEYAARMTAMDSATNNASELIDRLTLNMNRARQAAITKEIIEIVSGAAAI